MTDFEFRKVRASLPSGVYHIGAVRLMMCHCLGRDVTMDECNAAMEKIWNEKPKGKTYKDIERSA